MNLRLVGIEGHQDALIADSKFNIERSIAGGARCNELGGDSRSHEECFGVVQDLRSGAQYFCIKRLGIIAVPAWLVTFVSIEFPLCALKRGSNALLRKRQARPCICRHGCARREI